jgi:hypothetical protein
LAARSRSRLRNDGVKSIKPHPVGSEPSLRPALPTAAAAGAPLRLAPFDPLGATLTEILRQVNDWLKFAEAKNAGIVGLASGGVLALMATVSARSDAVWEVRTGFAASALFLALSLVCGLLSFLPRTNLSGILGRATLPPTKTDNLLFYGHLARYAPQDLVDAVARRYFEPEALDIDHFHLDLATQITTNARITLDKLRLFSYAVALFGIAVAFVLAAMIGLAFT